MEDGGIGVRPLRVTGACVDAGVDGDGEGRGGKGRSPAGSMGAPAAGVFALTGSADVDEVVPSDGRTSAAGAGVLRGGIDEP